MTSKIKENELIAGLKKSTTEAYNSFKKLVSYFDSEETRSEARSFLEHLKINSKNYKYFKLVQIPINGPEGFGSLELFQLPSTFAPEEWSYTFYEGLNRYPKERFVNKKVCELGCGNGWISLSLAVKTGASNVYGVDINPKAVVLSKLNLYMNALSSSGDVKFLPDSKSLLDKVVFAESDLMAYFKSNDIHLDIVTGCIPQVLSPDEDIELTDIREELSDEALYDLSNYAPSLGYIEDQFGLGLIAKALEESIEMLSDNGRVILNLGGRPGQEVLESLFLRRGFSCEKIWQTKVWQAGDTDISALVSIEQNSHHRFEFYTSLTSDTPINAALAETYAKNGGKVAHSLSVYEGKLNFPQQTKKIHKFLNQSEFENCMDNLDLSIKEKNKLEEKTEFLSYLTGYLSKDDTFGYENVKGMSSFREKLSHFFNFYYKLGLNQDNIMLFPSRAEFVRSLILTYDFNKLLVSETYLRSENQASPKYMLRNSMFKEKVYETPLNVEISTKIISKIKPDFFISELASYENESTVAFEKLIDACKQAGTRLLVDVSNSLELSSSPRANGVLRYLSENKLPDHVVILGGFVRNAVYQKLSLCFLISDNKTLLNHMANAAELNYSRVPVISQLYYEAILDDLLEFQLSEVKNSGTPLDLKENQSYEKILSKESAISFAHSAIKSEYRDFNSDSIRLDYGENELGVSVSFKRSVFDTFGKKDLNYANRRLEGKVKKSVAKNFKGFGNGRVLFGLGAASIFSAISYRAALKGKEFIFPKGNYGMFYASAIFNKCKLVEVKTSEKNDYVLTSEDLSESLKGTSGAWVYLQYPFINPTGKRVIKEQLLSLIKTAHAHNATVVIDTIFKGLEHNESSKEEIVSYLESENSCPRVYIIGGVSKEYAAGGLRVGYVWTNDASEFDEIKSELSSPHDTSLAVFEDLLIHIETKDQDLAGKLVEQRTLLKKHADALIALLNKHDWQVITPDGGLFILAKSPKNLQGKKVSDLLFEASGVSVNSAEWTGIKDTYRFVLSVKPAKFEEALVRLSGALSKLSK